MLGLGALTTPREKLVPATPSRKGLFEKWRCFLHFLQDRLLIGQIVCAAVSTMDFVVTTRPRGRNGCRWDLPRKVSSIGTGCQ